MRPHPAYLLLALSAACSSTAPPGQPDLRSDLPAADLAPGEGARRDLSSVDRLQPDTAPRPPAKWVSIAGAPPLIYHTATLLKDGRVLIVGGERRGASGPGAMLPEAFLFDPTSSSFAPGGTLAAARSGHTATRLADGRVLVVGGWGEGATAPLGTELFDPSKPVAQAWSAGPPLPSPRDSHQAVLLGDGKVLVSGGKADAAYLDALLLYDPASSAWVVPLFKLGSPRASHASLVLSDGRVLLAGGSDGKVFSSSLEVLQPKTGTVTALSGTLSKGRIALTAHPLFDGRILLLGGWCGFGCAISGNDLYDPATDTVSATSHFGAVPGFHAGVVLQDQRVLSTGGVTDRATPTGTDAVVALDKTGWQQLPPLAHPRHRHTATLLADGTVLVMGGLVDFGKPYVAVAERLTP